MSIPLRVRNLGFARHVAQPEFALLIGSFVVLAIFHFVDPDSSILPACPLYHYTGLYCPGCGITRALHLLSTGHPLAASGMNPLLALMLASAAVLLIVRRLPGSKSAAVLNSPYFHWTIFALVVLFTVARNLPWEPFRLLAPSAMLGP